MTNLNASLISNLSILDGALRIGKQSPEFDEQEVIRAVRAFEFARMEEGAR